MASRSRSLLCAAVVLLAGLVTRDGGHLTASAASAPPYLRESLLDFCPRDGSKRELKLGTKAAILTLRLDAANALARDLVCHLEVEASEGYGLHVYMDEMSLRGDEASACVDYVQFGRDLLSFTTYRSPKYCGHRPKVNVSDAAEMQFKAYSGSQSRIHIEEKDDEMDLWVRVGADVSAAAEPRNLSLVITAFKKSCGDKDPHFRACPQSSRCVRNEFFCDSYTNCAWPSGDTSTDELKCSENAPDGVFSISNIPVIIIVIILVCGLLVVFGVAMRHFFRNVKSSSSSSSAAARHSSRRRDMRESTPPLLRHGDCASAVPTAPSLGPTHVRLPTEPPTYAEAVADAPRRQPPPYEG